MPACSRSTGSGDIAIRKTNPIKFQDAPPRARDELQRRAGQLARLAARLALVEQRERQRLANLLHDGLQQDLIAAKFAIERLVRDCQTAGGATELHEQLLALLDGAIRTTRTLTVNLSPPLSRGTNLKDVLAWLAAIFERDHGLCVRTTLNCDLRIAQEELRAAAFDATRESLLNVVKHAGVRQVELICRSIGPARLLIRIRDLGKGFELADKTLVRAEEYGFGLFAMRERIGLLGGDVAIDTAPGAGTVVNILIPILDENNTREHEITCRDQMELTTVA